MGQRLSPRTTHYEESHGPTGLRDQRSQEGGVSQWVAEAQVGYKGGLLVVVHARMGTGTRGRTWRARCMWAMCSTTSCSAGERG